MFMSYTLIEAGNSKGLKVTELEIAVEVAVALSSGSALRSNRVDFFREGRQLQEKLREGRYAPNV
jgi:hypothetical protein